MTKKIAFLFVGAIVSTSLFGVESNMPSPDYKFQVGLDNEPKVSGTAVKSKINSLPERVQIPETVKKPAPSVEKVDLMNAYILKQIEESRAKKTQQQQQSLIVLPAGYTQELKAYSEALALKGSEDVASSKEEKAEKLLFMRCRSAQDYKITTDTTIKMYCRGSGAEAKDSLYRVNASLAVENNTLVSVAYMLEDEMGRVFPVNREKSRLFNAASGSSNLATFVDKRALDKAEQGAAGAFATQAPALAKDYIDQSNKADTAVTQSDNGNTVTTAQSTTNPKPDAGDYGISLLISMLGDGMKAGVDQFYLDLGYIYYIPRDTVVEAEIVIEVEK